jgi:hypothetical protein
LALWVNAFESYWMVRADIKAGHKFGVRQESLGKEEGMSEVT